MKKTYITTLVLLINLTLTGRVLELTDLDYSKVLEMTKKSPIKIIIVFYSEKCPHCLTFLPSLEKIAEQYYTESKLVAFFKMDVFKYKNILNIIQIGSLPDIKAYGNGEFIDKAKNGYADAIPIFKSWLENVNNDSKNVVNLARVDKSDFDRNEVEFKMKLDKGYLGKIDNHVGFAEVLFKEIYDSREHNWFKDDEDLIEAFF